METTRLAVLAIVLIGAGCAATILSALVFPLWIRVRGQAHGRFAGLVAYEPQSERGSKIKIGGPSQAVAEESEPKLIVA